MAQLTQENFINSGNTRFRKIGIFLILSVISFVVLLFASKASPFFAFNEWPDLNCYLTVGRGLVNGKVMYKDIYDQKGPLVFFIFAFINIFPNVYFATFILEWICLTAFLYILFLISSRYLNTKLSIFSCAASAIIICFSASFVTGGGAIEELCLPFFAYFLLLFLKNLENCYQPTKKTFLLMGSIIGILFLMKFTLIVLPCIATFIILFNLKKQLCWKKIIANVLIMLLGFIIPFIPVLIYFIITNALGDFVYSYFYCNLFMYSVGKGNIFLHNIKKMSECLPIIVLSFLSVLAFCLKNKSSKRNIIEYVLLFFFNFLFLVFPQCHIYYYHQLSVFVGLFIAQFISISFSNNSKPPNYIYRALACFLLVSISAINVYDNLDTMDIFKSKEEFIQYQVAEDIKLMCPESPTLFCYKMYDEGFYEALDTVPTEKYFMQYNFSKKSFPELFASYDNAIANQTSEFVLAYSYIYQDNKELLDSKYQIIGEYSQVVDKDTGSVLCVLLFRKI